MASQITTETLMSALSEALRSTISKEAERLRKEAITKFERDLEEATASIAGRVYSQLESHIDVLTDSREVRMSLLFKRK